MRKGCKFVQAVFSRGKAQNGGAAMGDSVAKDGVVRMRRKCVGTSLMSR